MLAIGINLNPLIMLDEPSMDLHPCYKDPRGLHKL